MKILIVCSYRSFRPDGINQFIKEQVNAVSALGVECEYYLVRGKGFTGYISEIQQLRRAIRRFRPDIIHAHYGLCGLLANITTRKTPVVTTYHGSDINNPKSRKFSLISLRLSAWNIFVSKRIMNIVHGTENRRCSLIPCGVDLTDDQLQTRINARKAMGWNEKDKKVLFAGMFEAIKDPDLANAAIDIVRNTMGYNVELLELRGYSRQEVNRLMCAVDSLLMTSKTEGSPQVIKEALACGCPIVSTDVGDVAERVNGIEGCFIAHTRNPQEIAESLMKAIEFQGETKGRERIIEAGLDNNQIARQIIEIYNRVKNQEKI